MSSRAVYHAAVSEGWVPPTEVSDVRLQWLQEMVAKRQDIPVPTTPQAALAVEALLYVKDGAKWPGEDAAIQYMQIDQEPKAHGFRQVCPRTEKVFTDKREWDSHLRHLRREFEEPENKIDLTDII